jgi:hypothetical protein
MAAMQVFDNVTKIVKFELICFFAIKGNRE